MTQYTKITDTDLAADALYDKVNDMVDALNSDKVDRAQLGFRKASTTYSVGMFCYCEYHPEFVLMCSAGGTSSSGALNTSGTLTDGQLLNDGTVIWTVCKVIHNRGVEVVNGLKTFADGLKSTKSIEVGNSTNTLAKVELYGGNGSYGGVIDFHNGNNTDDYTSRIIEDTSGVLNVNGAKFNRNGAPCTVPVHPNEDTQSSLQIDTVGARDSKLANYPTFNGNNTFGGNNTFTKEVVQKTNVSSSSTIPSEDQFQTGYCMVDKDGVLTGYIQVQYTKDGNVITNLTSTRNVDGTPVYNTFSVGTTPSGEGFANATRKVKKSIVNWCMPDYNSAIGIASGYVSVRNGIVVGRRGASSSNAIIYVNGRIAWDSGVYDAQYGAGTVLVGIGDTITTSGSFTSLTLYPMKGES